MMSCSRKTIPEITPIVINTDCDSLIKNALSKIDNAKSVNNDSCYDYSFELIQLSENLSRCKSDFLKSQLETVSKPQTIITGKFRKSFNIDNSETIRLKHSILLKDSAIANLQAENIALNSKLKDKVKVSKGSAVGDGNTIYNKKKDRFWLGVIVAYGSLYILKALLTIISTYVPISIPIITILKKFLP